MAIDEPPPVNGEETSSLERTYFLPWKEHTSQICSVRCSLSVEQWGDGAKNDLQSSHRKTGLK